MDTRRSRFTKGVQVARGERWSLLGVLLVLSSSGPVAWTQEGESLTLNGQGVEEYLTQKYHINRQAHDVSSTLQQTPYGPQGTLHFRGEMAPPPGRVTRNMVTTGETTHDRARALARAFLQEEAALFGVTNMEEIRETKIGTDKGHDGDYTYLRYGRYIHGVELEGVDVRMAVGPDETIRHGMAQLAPAPPELYEAARRPTLTEADIRRVIEADLQAPEVTPGDIQISKLKQLAIPAPPYVLWTAWAYVADRGGGGQGSWDYRMNAFTGEILKKTSAIRYLRTQPTGDSP